ncbi:hypothetical protein B0H16DRAFT_132360 [Mycena metata]|uniref:Uncharacterized protein n=1 Tax=Mycena metata TaxID=1033252 RepID=A0AAD7I560_9AGAR|nr:hypothetical protein B0H16DRAFT_132360 [Mycena metata]
MLNSPPWWPHRTPMMPPYTDAIEPRRLAHPQYSWGLGTKRTTTDPATRLSSSDSPLFRCLHPPPLRFPPPPPSRLPPQLPLLPSHPLPHPLHLPPNRRTRGSRRTPRTDRILAPPSSFVRGGRESAALVAEKTSPICGCAGDHVELKFLSPTSSSGRANVGVEGDAGGAGEKDNTKEGGPRAPCSSAFVSFTQNVLHAGLIRTPANRLRS